MFMFVSPPTVSNLDGGGGGGERPVGVGGYVYIYIEREHERARERERGRERAGERCAGVWVATPPEAAPGTAGPRAGRGGRSSYLTSDV